MDLAIIGAGAFGLSAALTLRRRGHEVRVYERGPIPHDDAASTDVSKLVRLDYGDDALYGEMAEESAAAFRASDKAHGERLYHELGILLLTRTAMREGEFEHDSLRTLQRRGLPTRRVERDWVSSEHPAWSRDAFADGYHSLLGGYVESGAFVARLAAEARALGVSLFANAPIEGLAETGSRVTGVRVGGARAPADVVLVAAGAFTPLLVPELDELTIVGQPVVLFAPEDLTPFVAPSFLPWAFEIAKTGYYGFPATQSGLVKVANHGVGRAIRPDAPRLVSAEDVAHFREFLRGPLPALAEAPVLRTRLCLYADTPDGDFLIDRHPALEGLYFASGDSGHAFKFAPVLGEIVADVVLGRETARTRRFARRARVAGREASRAG
jgi:glycine/D-amino acid oxidase-like deaminating enzyme